MSSLAVMLTNACSYSPGDLGYMVMEPFRERSRIKLHQCRGGRAGIWIGLATGLLPKRAFFPTLVF